MRPGARTRHRNLEILIGEAGTARALARRAGTSDSYLSQVRNRGGGHPRGIGDRLAAMLEQAMHKPPGWLDEPHDGAPGHPGDVTDDGTLATTVEAAPGDRLYPLVSWERAATHGATSVAEEPRTLFPCPVRCSPDTFVLRVHGASMAPRFRDGDLIFVDPQATPVAGRYVVVRMEGTDEAAFRQLVEGNGRRYLRALNPEWPRPVVEVTDAGRICGVVVFRGEHV